MGQRLGRVRTISVPTKNVFGRFFKINFLRKREKIAMVFSVSGAKIRAPPLFGK
jgi:hypothetical protein